MMGIYITTVSSINIAPEVKPMEVSGTVRVALNTFDAVESKEQKD